MMTGIYITFATTVNQLNFRRSVHNNFVELGS